MKKHQFTWPIRVYYEDIDLGGVVYHANYLKFMERARSEWLRSLGFDQTELRVNHGLLLVVVEIDIRYHQPARFEDLLCIATALESGSRATMTFTQRIHKESVDGELLAGALVKAACVKEGNFRPTALPAGMIEAMEQYK